MHRQFNIQQFYILPTQCIDTMLTMSQQTANFALYSTTWLISITKIGSVYCAVRTGSWN